MERDTRCMHSDSPMLVATCLERPPRLFAIFSHHFRDAARGIKKGACVRVQYRFCSVLALVGMLLVPTNPPHLYTLRRSAVGG